MKKILFVIALFVAASFASCGSHTGAGSDTDSLACDSDTVVVDSLAGDSVVADSLVK